MKGGIASPPSATDPRAVLPLRAEEQKPSAEPGKRLNPEEAQKFTGIVPAPSEIAQVAADAAVRHDRPRYLDDRLDVDETTITGGHPLGMFEEADVAGVIEIGDRADAPG